MERKHQFSLAVKACVGAVICLGVVAFLLFSDPLIPDDRGHFFVVLVLSAIIGMHSMRYSPSSLELSSSHPFLIYSIATFGPRAAIVIILVGIATTLTLRKTRPPLIRVAFNLSVIALSTAIAGGGEQATFSSLRFGEAFVNLSTAPRYKGQWWGRAIFRVDNADVYQLSLTAAGLQAEQPRDAPWGERYFHLTDPDGHELSFAQLLPSAGPDAPT